MKRKNGKIADRKEILLKAAYELLKKQDDNPYIIDCLSTLVHYDGVDCDGSCLMEDIAIELDIDKE